MNWIGILIGVLLGCIFVELYWIIRLRNEKEMVEDCYYDKRGEVSRLHQEIEYLNFRLNKVGDEFLWKIYDKQWEAFMELKKGSNYDTFEDDLAGKTEQLVDRLFASSCKIAHELLFASKEPEKQKEEKL